MAQTKKKFIRLGTGADDLNSRDIPANFTPSNYTPEEVGTEGDNKTSAHLKGIDIALASAGGSPGDIPLTSFSAANDQATPANVTGFAFANGSIRSFNALVSVTIDATANLYEQFILNGIQKDSLWEMSQNSVGDSSGVVFNITTSGQIQYVSENLAGFASNTIKFRAITTDL